MSIDFEKPRMRPKDERELELLKSENERKGLLIEYVAMMADVELPEEDEQEADDGE